MNKTIVFCFSLVFIVTVGILVYGSGKDSAAMLKGAPRRIVSAAPAITETLYKLNLGDEIVGVTQFCDYPPEAAQKPKVAGFREINLEAIAQANPDLVILPYDMSHYKAGIESLGIPVLLFDYQSLDNFLKAVEEIGRVCAKESEAAKLVDNFRGARVEGKSSSSKKPTVFFAILNPDEYNRPVSEMTIIGADKFYNGIIEAAGGQNAYQGNIPFPRVSLETLIKMNPDFIVLATPELADITQLQKNWRNLNKLKGTQGERLVILNDAADTIPGPRSVDTIRKLAAAIGAER